METYRELERLLNSDNYDVSIVDWHVTESHGFYRDIPIFYIDESCVLLVYTDNADMFGLDINEIIPLVSKYRHISAVSTSFGPYYELDTFLSTLHSSTWSNIAYGVYAYKGTPCMWMNGNTLTIYKECLERFGLSFYKLVKHMREKFPIQFVYGYDNYNKDLARNRESKDDLRKVLAYKYPYRYHLWESNNGIISYDDKEIIHIHGKKIDIISPNCYVAGLTASDVRWILGEFYPKGEYQFNYKRG